MKKNLRLSCFLLCAMVIFATAGCGSDTVADSSDSGESADVQSSKTGSVSSLDYVETSDDFQIQLTDAMVSKLESATYCILGQDDVGYYPVLEGRNAGADEDNIVHIPKEQSVPTLYFESTNESLLLPRMQEKPQNGLREWYTRFFAFVGDSDIDESCYMDLNITEPSESTVDDLDYTMNPRLSGMDNPLTEPVAVENWNKVRVSKVYATDLYDLNGMILPVTEWTFDILSVYEYPYMDMKDGMKFQEKSLKELSGTYYCQLILKFQDGSSIASDFMLLQESDGDPCEITEPSEQTETVTIDTENGSMVFGVYEDHAVLAEYSGNDVSVNLPDHINGVPVTIIDSGAFANNVVLQEAVFPSTLKQIRSQAFYGTNLTGIELPDSLEYIGAEAFGAFTPPFSFETETVYDMETLNIGKNVKWIGDGAFDGYGIRSFSVDSNNPYYMSEGGVIYTKDQSFLLACPTGKNGDFRVPDGVTGISSEAFKFNGGFDDIFKDCDGITSISLPDSVQAFSCNYLPSNLQSLSIGAGLEEWDAVYNCSKVPTLSISEDNSFYQLDDGVIYDGKKSKLYYYLSTNTDSEFTIPDTVTIIDKNAFSNNTNLREIHIPSGLNLTEMEATDIAGTLYSLDNLISIHVEKGNSALCSLDGVLFTADQSILLCYPRGKEESEYDIPEGVTAVSTYAFYFNDIIERLSLPSTLEKLKILGETGTFLDNMSDLNQVSVSAENPYFTAEGAFLSSLQDNALVFASGNYEESIVYLPEEIVDIKEDVFGTNLDGVTEIRIPEGVTTIESGNFNYISQSDQWDVIDIYLPDSLKSVSDSSFRDSPGIVIHASAGSYAQSFAEQNQIAFKANE